MRKRRPGGWWGLLLLVAALGCNGTGGRGGSAVPTGTRTPTQAPLNSPTPTAIPVNPIGPVITFFGVARPDGCQIGCFDFTGCRCSATPTPVVTEDGLTVFPAQGGGRGLLVVEGKPGLSGFPPGINLVPDNPGDRPDLQIESSRPLGDGSLEVCDQGPAPPLGTGGGIPSLHPPDFGGGEMITDALNDFACRFAVQPSRDDACTLDNFGNFSFVGDETTIQFCNQITSVAGFPPGETMLSARLRDVLGNLGPEARIAIRNGSGTSSTEGEGEPRAEP